MPGGAPTVTKRDAAHRPARLSDGLGRVAGRRKWVPTQYFRKLVSSICRRSSSYGYSSRKWSHISRRATNFDTSLGSAPLASASDITIIAAIATRKRGSRRKLGAMGRLITIWPMVDGRKLRNAASCHYERHARKALFLLALTLVERDGP